MRALLVHNPKAGEGRVGADELVAMLRRAGLSPLYRSKKEPGLQDALGEPADLVVVAGGDGTVADVFEHLAGRDTPALILPLGTANNVARSLGLDGSVEDLLRGWQTAQRRPFDVWAAQGPWGRSRCIEGMGLGALARATADGDAAQPASSRRLAFGHELLVEAVTEARPERVRLTLDGEELAPEPLLLEALNISHAGPCLCLAPQADPGDGLLDLVWLEAARRGDMLAWLAEPQGPPPLSARRGRDLRLTWAEAPLRLDDEFPDPPSGPCTLAMRREAVVNVLVPKGSEVP